MKQTMYFSFAYGPRMPEKYFAAAGFAPEEYERCSITRTAETEVPADDPRLERLGAILAEVGIRPFRRMEVKYSKREIEDAPFVQFALKVDGRGHSGLDQDMEFDLSAGCPACGTGAKQLSALRLRHSDLPNKRPVSSTWHSEYLLREDLVSELVKMLGSDRGLRQIEECATHRKLNWWQILPDVHMPPMLREASDVITDQQCQACRREGFFADISKPCAITYNAIDVNVETLPAFVSTWEYFGHSHIRKEEGYMLGFAQPCLLVSRQVVQVLLKQKVPRLNLTPVRFL
jgi:hypothetical protein